MNEPKIRDIEGSNAIVFDGTEFADSVCENALKLREVDKELAEKYLAAMSGVSITMENCKAVFDNTSH